MHGNFKPLLLPIGPTLFEKKSVLLGITLKSYVRGVKISSYYYLRCVELCNICPCIASPSQFATLSSALGQLRHIVEDWSFRLKPWTVGGPVSYSQCGVIGQLSSIYGCELSADGKSWEPLHFEDWTAGVMSFGLARREMSAMLLALLAESFC